MYNLIKLTREEEYAELVKYKLLNAQLSKEKLVMNSLRYLKRFINKFPYSMRDDLINEACLYICRALESTIIDKRCKFSTYAYMTAKKYLCIYLTANLSKTINNIEDFEGGLSVETEDYNDLYNAINKLNKKDRDLIYQKYFVGDSNKECSDKLGGRGRNYIRNQEVRIFKKLRNYL